MGRRLEDTPMYDWVDPNYVDPYPNDYNTGALGIVLIPFVVVCTSTSFLNWIVKIFSSPINHIYEVVIVSLIGVPLGLWITRTLAMMWFNLIKLSIRSVRVLFTEGPRALWKQIVHDY